jgi:cytochrome P450
MFGEDYPRVAQSFKILHDEPARSLHFAQAFAKTRQVVVELIERRLRSKSKGTDILGLLMNARGQDGDSMPDSQAVKEAMTSSPGMRLLPAPKYDLVSGLPKPGSRDAALGGA